MIDKKQQQEEFEKTIQILDDLKEYLNNMTAEEKEKFNIELLRKLNSKEFKERLEKKLEPYTKKRDWNEILFELLD